jgi:signal transduction histidine kinase
VTTAFGVYQAIGYPPTVAGVGLYVALYSVGAHQERFRLGVALAFVTAYASLSIVLAALGSPENFLGFLTYLLVLLTCAGAGAWIRGRRAEEAERNRERSRMAITRERARIARELHDVVTHHVTAMVVQADAAQFLLAQPDRVVSGLGAVSDTGRRALTELRHLLDVLDASEDDATGDRTPAVGRLVDLVEETRRAGLVVDMTQEGERVALDGGVELAVYRVVQEGLTNAVKHARNCPTSVLIRYGSDRVEVEVSTLGPVYPETAPGRGLTGLRERVGLLGGELRAGARAGGGFTVAARIPARGAA